MKLKKQFRLLNVLELLIAITLLTFATITMISGGSGFAIWLYGITGGIAIGLFISDEQYYHIKLSDTSSTDSGENGNKVDEK